METTFFKKKKKKIIPLVKYEIFHEKLTVDKKSFTVSNSLLIHF